MGELQCVAFVMWAVLVWGRGGASVLQSGEIAVRGSCFLGVQFRGVKVRGNGGKGQLWCGRVAV